MQQRIHGGEQPPSERAIDEHRSRFEREYRAQTEGEYPVPRLREPAVTAS